MKFCFKLFKESVSGGHCAEHEVKQKVKNDKYVVEPSVRVYYRRAIAAQHIRCGDMNNKSGKNDISARDFFCDFKKPWCSCRQHDVRK